MSHIRNTRPYHGGARRRPDIIDEIHDQWCKDNGYPIRARPGKGERQASSSKPEELHAENTNRFGKVQASSLSCKLK